MEMWKYICIIFLVFRLSIFNSISPNATHILGCGVYKALDDTYFLCCICNIAVSMHPTCYEFGVFILIPVSIRVYMLHRSQLEGISHTNASV